MLNIKKNSVYFSIFLFLSASFIAAGGVDIPIEKMSLAALLKMIISNILDILVPVIVLAIVYVGFLFVKAQGNESELTKAKEALTYVLIGTAVIIGSNALYSIFYAAVDKTI